MKQHDYKSAVDLRRNFVKTREEFTKNRSGIIMPIRAMVLDLGELQMLHHGEHNVEAFIQSIARRAFAVAADYGVTKGEIQNGHFIWRSDYQEVTDVFGATAESKIIGYIAAVWNKEENCIDYGLSYCHDKDYQNFCNDFGQMLAMRRAMSGKCALPPYVLDDMDTVNLTKGSRYMYLWPFTYGQQIKYFIARCDRYFKQNTKSNNGTGVAI